MNIVNFGIVALIMGITWIPSVNVKAVRSTGLRQSIGTDANSSSGSRINRIIQNKTN